MLNEFPDLIVTKRNDVGYRFFYVLCIAHAISQDRFINERMLGNILDPQFFVVARSLPFDALYNYIGCKRARLEKQILMPGMNDIECTEDHNACFHTSAARRAARAAAAP